MEPILNEFEVVKFLVDKGGRCTNYELVSNFRGVLNDPRYQAEARLKFKDIINTVATVGEFQSVKYIELKKDYGTSNGVPQLDPQHVSGPSSLSSEGSYNSPLSQNFQPYWRYRLSTSKQMPLLPSKSPELEAILRSSGRDSTSPRQVPFTRSVSETTLSHHPPVNRNNVNRSTSEENSHNSRYHRGSLLTQRVDENENYGVQSLPDSVRRTSGQFSPDRYSYDYPQDANGMFQSLPYYNNRTPLEQTPLVYDRRIPVGKTLPQQPIKDVQRSDTWNGHHREGSGQRTNYRRMSGSDGVRQDVSGRGGTNFEPSISKSVESMHGIKQKPADDSGFYSSSHSIESPVRSAMASPPKVHIEENPDFHTANLRNVARALFRDAGNDSKAVRGTGRDTSPSIAHSSMGKPKDLIKSQSIPSKNATSVHSPSNRPGLRDSPNQHTSPSSIEPHMVQTSQSSPNDSRVVPNIPPTCSKLDQPSSPSTGGRHVVQTSQSTKEPRVVANIPSRASKLDQPSSPSLDGLHVVQTNQSIPNEPRVVENIPPRGTKSDQPVVNMRYSTDTTPSGISSSDACSLLSEVSSNESGSMLSLNSLEFRRERDSVFLPAGSNDTPPPLPPERHKKVAVEDDKEDKDNSTGRCPPMAAETGGKVRDRVQHFDDMEKKRNTKRSHSPLTPDKENRIHSKVNGADDDVSISVLDPKLKREWFVKAAQCDYHALTCLLKKEPKLAAIKDSAMGYSALHWAAKQGDANVVKLIAGAYRVNPNIRSNGGYTPVHLATLHKHDMIVHLLIHTYGADPSVRDYSGKRADQYPENYVRVIAGHKTTERRPLKQRPVEKEVTSSNSFMRIGSLNLRKARKSTVFASVRGRSWGSASELRLGSHASMRKKLHKSLIEKKSESEKKNDSDSDGTGGFSTRKNNS